jgi:hypothetical protein
MARLIGLDHEVLASVLDIRFDPETERRTDQGDCPAVVRVVAKLS